jgi:hypothetical protein
LAQERPVASEDAAVDRHGKIYDCGVLISD